MKVTHTTWKMGEINIEAPKLGTVRGGGEFLTLMEGSCSVFVFCVPDKVKYTGLGRQYKMT
jgi:hypothetical protein